jgi:3-deoxy-7-phosphoheptulonate synthase
MAKFEAACVVLDRAGRRPQVVIDFSHAYRSRQYQYRRQIMVSQDAGGRIAARDLRLIGAITESHLIERAKTLR